MFLHKKRYSVLLIALLCTTLFLFAGCGNRNANNTTPQTTPTNPTQTPNDENNNATEDNNGTEDNTSMSNEDKENLKNGTDENRTGTDGNDHEARAEKIADAIVEKVPAVSNAHVLISEKMAYAAVEIDNTANTNESANLKDEIVKVIKETDTEIEDAYVSEDADTFTRIGEIGKDIANGKPISGFAEEIENLFVRITPGK